MTASTSSIDCVEKLHDRMTSAGFDARHGLRDAEVRLGELADLLLRGVRDRAAVGRRGLDVGVERVGRHGLAVVALRPFVRTTR